MFFALGMCQIAAFVGMESQAESTLIGADMIPHEVRVFGDVNCLKC